MAESIFFCNVVILLLTRLGAWPGFKHGLMASLCHCTDCLDRSATITGSVGIIVMVGIVFMVGIVVMGREQAFGKKMVEEPSVRKNI